MWKKKKPRKAEAEPKKTNERRCVVCGAPHEHSYLWDIHVDPKTRELVDTCSAKCRKKGGYKERKASV